MSPDFLRQSVIVFHRCNSCFILSTPSSFPLSHSRSLLLKPPLEILSVLFYHFLLLFSFFYLHPLPLIPPSSPFGCHSPTITWTNAPSANFSGFGIQTSLSSGVRHGRVPFFLLRLLFSAFRYSPPFNHHPPFSRPAAIPSLPFTKFYLLCAAAVTFPRRLLHVRCQVNDLLLMEMAFALSTSRFRRRSFTLVQKHSSSNGGGEASSAAMPLRFEMFRPGGPPPRRTPLQTSASPVRAVE